MVTIKGVAAKMIDSARVPLIMVEHDASDRATYAILVDHLPDGELSARHVVALTICRLRASLTSNTCMHTQARSQHCTAVSLRGTTRSSPWML